VGVGCGGLEETVMENIKLTRTEIRGKKSEKRMRKEAKRVWKN
jgi:hypothetical protein